MYNEIEFICAGNNGRSPVAEAAGRKLAQELGIEERIRIFSSGTTVDVEKLGDLRVALVPYIEATIRNGLLPADRAKKIDSDPVGVLDELIAIEERWRNRYIAESTGFDYTKHIRRQTVALSGERLILPVDEANLKKTREIYDGSGHNPTIEVLPAFIGLDLNLHQVDVRDYEDYSALAEKVERAAKEAVLKTLES